MRETSSPLDKPYVAACTLLIITQALYFGSVFEILYTQKTINLDDTKLIHGLVNSPMVFQDIFKTYGHYYRPFINFSFWLDQTFWGANAFSFRLTNLLIHSSNVLLLFFLCRLVLRTNPYRKATSFFSALLFACHPICVESVSWISGRTDLLAVFWSFLSLLFYFSGREKREKIKLVLALLLLAPAILSKEVAYATPLLFLGLELRYLQQRGRLKKAAVPTVCLLVAAAAYVFFFQPELLFSVTLGFATIIFYLKKFLFPFPLLFNISNITTPFYYVTGLLLPSVLALFWRFLPDKKGTLGLWALLGLLPAVYIALVAPAWTRWAERYLYYSLAPLSILLGSFLIDRYQNASKSKKKYLQMAMACICIFFSLATFKRSFLWNDNILFWKNELLKNSQSSALYLHYGISLLEKKRVEEAERIFREGLKFKGMKHLLYFNLGKIERRRTNFSGAKSYYQKALEEADSDPRLVLNRKSLKGKINSSLGRLFAEMGNQEEGSVGKMHLSKAAESFIMAFKSDRSRIFDLRRAALIQIRIGNKKEAQKTLQTFLSQNPPKHYQTWALRKIRTLSEPGKF